MNDSNLTAWSLLLEWQLPAGVTHVSQMALVAILRAVNVAQVLFNPCAAGSGFLKEGEKKNNDDPKASTTRNLEHFSSTTVFVPDS